MYWRRTIRQVTAKAVYRILISFLAVAPAVPALNMTTVIMIRRAKQIALAADSKAMAGRVGGFDEIRTCKIEQSGAVFFAFSGATEDHVIGWSASKLVRDGKVGTIQARAVNFEEAIKEPIFRSVQRAYEGAPRADYRKYFGLGDAIILEAIFAGMENDIAHFQKVDVIKVEDAQGNPLRIETRIHGCPGDSCGEKGQVAVMTLGQKQVAEAELQRINHALGGIPDDDSATLRHLIELEIAAQPDKVGPPVTILMLDNTGYRWIAKGECDQK